MRKCKLSDVPSPEHPLLPDLVDLETRFDADAIRDYTPADLIRYALDSSDYWAELALGWLDQGAPNDELDDALLTLEEQNHRPQAVRHHARSVRKAL